MGTLSVGDISIRINEMQMVVRVHQNTFFKYLLGASNVRCYTVDKFKVFSQSVMVYRRNVMLELHHYVTMAFTGIWVPKTLQIE